jgi:signal transduction histidine kinase
VSTSLRAEARGVEARASPAHHAHAAPAFTFRAKVMAIVAIVGAALTAVVIAGALLAARTEREIETIEARYLPLVQLQPKLEGELEHLERAFQDAVAAGDATELAAASESRRRFLAQLDGANVATDPAAAAALARALDDYFSAADDVSNRLIARETGEDIVDAARAMQEKQARVEELITKTTALDPRKLAAAFKLASRTGVEATRYQLMIGLACLALVLVLSLALSRSVLRAVRALVVGLERFGKGDFTRRIPVETRDELGEVAEHANRMAASLERAGVERERMENALKSSNRELEAFSYSVAHDLRAPLRGINGFSHALMEDYGDKLDAEAKGYLLRIAGAAERMGHLIDALLALSRLARTKPRRETVSMTRLAEAVMEQLRSAQPTRAVEFTNGAEIVVFGDPTLLRALLENLLGNAWKFTGARAPAHIAFGVEPGGEEDVYFVRDDGAGFDMAFADKLFAPFQRLHTSAEFAGTGIGLATVQRIVHRHGGRIWADGAVGRGATFHFTLPSGREGAKGADGARAGEGASL